MASPAVLGKRLRGEGNNSTATENKLQKTSTKAAPQRRSNRLQKATPICQSEDSACFHLFGKLPAELRLETWEYAVADLPKGGRFIEPFNINPEDNTVDFYISSKFPNFFSVSREARADAARATGGQFVELSMHHPSGTRTFKLYFNVQVDYLLISARSVQFSGDKSGQDLLFGLFPLALIKSLRHILLSAVAVDHEAWITRTPKSNQWIFTSDFIDVLSDMSRLEDVAMIVQYDGLNWSQGHMFKRLRLESGRRAEAKGIQEFDFDVVQMRRATTSKAKWRNPGMIRHAVASRN